MCRGIANGGRRCPTCLDRNKKSSYDRARYAAAAATAGLNVDGSLIPQLSPVEEAPSKNNYSNLPNISEITAIIARTSQEEGIILVNPSTLQKAHEGNEDNRLKQEMGKRILEGFSCEIALVDGRTLTVEAMGTRIYCEEWTSDVNGTISLDGEIVGRWLRVFKKLRGEREQPEAHYDYLNLDEDIQGQRIGQKLLTHFDNAVLAMGVRTVKVEANLDVGGYAWAKAGYDWDSDPASPTAKLMPWIGKDDHFIQRFLTHTIEEAGDSKGEIEKMITRLNKPYSNSYPTPLELAMLGRGQAKEVDGKEMWVGKNLMMKATWYGSRKLS